MEDRKRIFQYTRIHTIHSTQNKEKYGWVMYMLSVQHAVVCKQQVCGNTNIKVTAELQTENKDASYTHHSS